MFLVLAAPGWAAAASGSLGGTTLIDPVVDTGTGVVDDVVGVLDPVTDAVTPIVDNVIDTVGPVVDDVTDTVDPVLDDVTDTVDPVLDDVTDTVDPILDDVTDTVDPILDDVTDTVDPITDTVTNTGTVGPVTDTVRDVTRPVQDRVQPITDRIEEQLSPIGRVVDDGGLLPGTTNQNRRGPARDRQGSAEAPGQDPRRAVRDEASGLLSTAPTASLVDPAAPAATRLTAAPVVAGVRDGAAIEQFVRGLARASRQFSFPLTVAGLVLLFLAVQGRLDARDPKLAARPEDEELMFA